MKRPTLRQLLQGGDRRSIGSSNQIAARILGNRRQLPQLIECLWSDDPIVRMRAADAAEKVSVKRADLLQPFKAGLLGLAEETTEAEVRWHLAMMLPRLTLTGAERDRARSTLGRYLEDRSSLVKTWAINGLAELAEGDAVHEAEAVHLLEKSRRTGTPAMKARARKLLKRFQGRGF